jgi:hypothetical protein
MKIDFTSGFSFIAKKETWFVGEATLDSDCTNWYDSMVLENGWGFFQGWTYESYNGYNGELPRQDEESCSFDEFDIYYNGRLIDEFTTYGDLKAIVRESRIDDILKKRN